MVVESTLITYFHDKKSKSTSNASCRYIMENRILAPWLSTDKYNTRPPCNSFSSCRVVRSNVQVRQALLRAECAQVRMPFDDWHPAEKNNRLQDSIFNTVVWKTAKLNSSSDLDSESLSGMQHSWRRWYRDSTSHFCGTATPPVQGGLALLLE